MSGLLNPYPLATALTGLGAATPVRQLPALPSCHDPLPLHGRIPHPARVVRGPVSGWRDRKTDQPPSGTPVVVNTATGGLVSVGRVPA
jgi:hypothetical protein